MLDWRAGLATCLIHGGATAAWPALNLFEITRRWPIGEPGDPFRFEAASTFPLRALEVPTTTRTVPADEWPLVLTRDRRRAAADIARRPVLALGSSLARGRDVARAPILCVSVNSAGGVASARVRRSSGSAAFDRRAVRAAWKARFRPDRPGRITLTIG